MVCVLLFLITIKNLFGLVDIEVGQVNFALSLARGQVLKKCICQPLHVLFYLKLWLSHGSEILSQIYCLPHPNPTVKFINVQSLWIGLFDILSRSLIFTYISLPNIKATILSAFYSYFPHLLLSILQTVTRNCSYRSRLHQEFALSK